MSTSSSNRSVLYILIGLVLLCLCVCALAVAAVVAFRSNVVRMVPALGPVLSVETATFTPAPTAVLVPALTSTPVSTVLAMSTAVPTQPPAPTEQAPTQGSSSTEATPTVAPTSAGPTAVPQPSSTLDANIAAQMDQIQQEVISIRGLQPSGTFTRDVLTPDQLRANVIRDFNKDNTPEDIHNQVVELAALGLLQPNFDLGTFTIDLLSEQIAGYYDNKTKAMYVVGNEFSGIERLTYSHEYTHALQDENYDIQNGLHYDTQYCREDSERCAGIQALIEGDATVTQLDWLQQFSTSQDRTDIMNFYNTLKTPIYDSAPTYMKEDLTFPYDYGQKFVQNLYNQGGWNAVDAAYANVPLSTEQIMHPDRYPSDKPVVVSLNTLTTTLGTGWQEVDHGVVGEWYTYLIFADGIDPSFRLDKNTASTAAEGWGGDAYETYYNKQSDQTVLALSYTWDTQKDSDEYAGALVDYFTKRFGKPASSSGGQTAWSYSNGYVIARQSGQAVQWVMAPDQATAEKVWAAINP